METVNLSHFYREDLAYGWPIDAALFRRDQALPFLDGHRLLYGHTHQLSPEGARHEASQRWTGRMESATGKRNLIADWFHAHTHRFNASVMLDMPSSPRRRH